MAPLNPDGTPGEPVQQPVTGAKKKIPKRRKVQEAEDGDDVRATVEMQLNRPRRAPGKKQSGKKKNDPKKKNKRAETPEGADEEMINREELKMAELTKDLRIGKKFSRHDELREKEKQKIVKAQLAKTNPDLAAMVEGTEEGEEVDEAGPAPAESQAHEEARQPVVGGPQMRLLGDQIVLDENSLQVDRHSIARREQGVIEEVVEDEFTKITTCGTHMKREKAQLWDMTANEIFWKGLHMFGTDFEMIAAMFPHRNRRQIKLKFNKEEKDNPAKIDRILKQLGNNSIDLNTYEEFSGVKLEEVADIKAEQDRIEAEQKAEEDRRFAEQAEVERKKKETIAAQRAAAQRALATSDDHDEQLVDYGKDGDSGEKENQPRHPQSSRHNPKGTPGDKPVYHWTRQPEARTAEQLRVVRENAPKKVYPWTKAATPKKTPKEAGAKRGRKKKGAPDETVQVLGDA
jgi:transcription factor TFIIIB component B''